MSTVRVADLPENEQKALREVFQTAPLNALLGLELTEICAEYAVATMRNDEQTSNQAGTLHGGAISALIDQICGAAAARGGRLNPRTHTLVTADLHVRYLARARGAWVSARADVLKAGRQLITVECKVTDEQGTLVAVGDFSSMIVPLRTS